LPDSAPETVRALVTVASLSIELATLRAATAPGAAPKRAARSNAAGAIVATSGVMRQLLDEVERLSGSSATVLLTGESGAGKEVIARAIHDASARRTSPYMTFNCGSVPRDLFEGQLFGYRRGSFTGATADHPGVIRSAHGGTLFLDEIGELPLDVQPKLLRFLENREVLPLGDARPTEVDVRLVAATHRDLLGLVRERRFREDLYYRLNVVPIRVPALRERPEDIAPLVRHFLERFVPDGASRPLLSPSAIGALLRRPWPGNVRELKNAVERIVAFSPLPRVLKEEHFT
ncbi:MAG: sigma-54-dependent Fis family transcriptional regulator, partial [Myxococcales bacterium]|nr:sigma-54-dependent Fis family transcriptional regulator [Myxococcales bacterium]